MPVSSAETQALTTHGFNLHHLTLAACVPGAGAALTLPLMRLLSLMSFSIT